MKLFVADKRKKGRVSETDYHWCDDGEILMFGQFQTEENRKGNEVSMCGIKSRKFTTHIIVKDLNVSKEFLLELITESVEKAMNCTVNDNGNYSINFGGGINMEFNINDILNELIDKASKFKDGELATCRGRSITSYNKQGL